MSFVARNPFILLRRIIKSMLAECTFILLDRDIINGSSESEGGLQGHTAGMLGKSLVKKVSHPKRKIQFIFL